MSGQVNGEDIDMSAVHGTVSEHGGVEHAAELVAFAEAVMAGDDASLADARRVLRRTVSAEALVDTCAVIGAFNVVDRIADSTGIPLDSQMDAMTTELRDELGLARFRSSANTPPG